jgi:hypothetical protein
VFVDFHNLIGVGIFGAGEHVDLETTLTEPPRYLRNVHIEPARIADAGRR